MFSLQADILEFILRAIFKKKQTLRNKNVLFWKFMISAKFLPLILIVCLNKENMLLILKFIIH